MKEFNQEKQNEITKTQNILKLQNLKNNIIVEYKRSKLGKHYIESISTGGDVLYFCTKYSQQKLKELNRFK